MIAPWPRGIGHPVDLHHLYNNASDSEVARYFLSFDSYRRCEALAYFMMWAPPRRCLRAFLDYGDMCDAPWVYRSNMADALRSALAKIALTDVLDLDGRAFYAELPDPVPIWRGCERGRERGISWTTSRQVAEGFARGKRCINSVPTLAQAVIPKAHVFGVFLERKEHEIAVDYRRLRKLKIDLPAHIT